MSNLIKSAAVVLAAVSTLAAGACASPARPEAMAALVSPAQTAAPGDRGYQQITVATVAGGEQTNPLWVSNVSDADFRAALEATLRQANYLSSGTGPLSLSVTLEEVQQPFAGLDMTVTTRARYRLTDASGAVLFEETVAASGTGTMGEAFVGVERLRIANEKSVQANLGEFLTLLRSSLR